MPPPRAASFAASAVCRGLAAAAVPAAAVGLASPLPSSLLALQARALGAAGAVVRTARRTAEGPLSPCRRDRSPAVRGCFRSVRVWDGRCHFAHSSLPLRVASDASDSAEVEAQAERYLKRFWKTASFFETSADLGHHGYPWPDGFRILLDNRPLKTPEGRLLVVPSHRRTLAMLVAGEWERQETVLKSHSLPLVCTFAASLYTGRVSVNYAVFRMMRSTSLVARSIDGLSDWDARKSAIDKLMKFLETDTVWYAAHSHISGRID
ncbi:MAG: hypothetical protein BJ554DRAFT_7471 [Olpidium bornovanus]|uniref:ATP synthase mitochondrial F1 complex assembly factor 2 n=1 Tax=Olpidium bornovanus TaxID=278681 RepID=A0A8H8DJE6_9FUNG|nr:MAG: hypothetical protein BJ554DRAFT_7471 [Olpidium bornovanus]